MRVFLIVVYRYCLSITAFGETFNCVIKFFVVVNIATAHVNKSLLK